MTHTDPQIVKKPCPACGHAGHRDKPELSVLDTTCTVCGWHYTSELAVAARQSPSEFAESLQ